MAHKIAPEHHHLKSPERRLEEMLASGVKPLIGESRPGHDVGQGQDRVSYRQPCNETASFRRFGFHNDGRVNSSDSGLFTAFENDEEPQTGHSQSNYHHARPTTFQSIHPGNHSHEDEYQNLYNYTKSKKFDRNRAQARMDTEAHSVKSQFDRQSLMKRHQNLNLHKPNQYSESTTNPINQDDLSQNKSRDHNNARDEIKQPQHLPFKVNKLENPNLVQTLHVEESSGRTSRFQVSNPPVNSPLDRNSVLHRNYSSQNKVQPETHSLHHNQQHVNCHLTHKQQRNASQDRQQSSYQDHQHQKPLDVIKQQHCQSLKQDIDFKQEHYQSGNKLPQSVLSFSPDYPHQHGGGVSASPLHQHLNQHIFNQESHQFQRQHSFSPPKVHQENAIGKESIDTTVAQNEYLQQSASITEKRFGNVEDFEKRDRMHLHTYQQEDANTKLIHSARHTRVRRRSKRNNNKTRKTPESPIPKSSPEQYCFEDFRSSDSDTEGLDASQLSTLTWVRGGPGRYSGQAALGRFNHGALHGFSGQTESSFTRSFLIGNHVFGVGQSMSARSLKPSTHSHGHGVVRSSLRVPELSSPIASSKNPRKEFYKPLIYSESVHADFPVPNPRLNTEIVSSKQNISIGLATRNSRLDKGLSKELPKENIDLSSYHDSDMETENPYEIYENCAVTEPNTGFQFSATNFQGAHDEEDDSTIYESINPPSLNGDGDKDQASVTGGHILLRQRTDSSFLGISDSVIDNESYNKKYNPDVEEDTEEDGYLSEAFR